MPTREPYHLAFPGLPQERTEPHRRKITRYMPTRGRKRLLYDKRLKRIVDNFGSLLYYSITLLLYWQFTLLQKCRWYVWGISIFSSYYFNLP
jgi:hypothetical protein